MKTHGATTPVLELLVSYAVNQRILRAYNMLYYKYISFLMLIYIIHECVFYCMFINITLIQQIHACYHFDQYFIDYKLI